MAQAAAALLGGEVADVEPLAGGDLSDVLCLGLVDGREAVVKGGPAPPVEAAMLQAIADAGAPAPRVLAVDAHVLVMQRVPGRSGAGRAGADLGRVLAGLHARTGERYGWPEDYAFGDVEISNAPADDWPRFWAERRLLVHTDRVPATVARRLERLATRLAGCLPAYPPPALLHGDLWNGNLMHEGNRISGLIDPACYYGHGEVDLAMLALFGGAGPDTEAAYGALPPGHAQRRAIYQLWPALVHLRLFGAGYRSLVERLLTEAGA